MSAIDALIVSLNLHMFRDLLVNEIIFDFERTNDNSKSGHRPHLKLKTTETCSFLWLMYAGLGAIAPLALRIEQSSFSRASCASDSVSSTSSFAQLEAYPLGDYDGGCDIEKPDYPNDPILPQKPTSGGQLQELHIHASCNQ
jgi:hypothetical protein